MSLAEHRGQHGREARRERGIGEAAALGPGCLVLLLGGGLLCWAWRWSRLTKGLALVTALASWRLWYLHAQWPAVSAAIAGSCFESTWGAGQWLGCAGLGGLPLIVVVVGGGAWWLAALGAFEEFE